MPIPRGILQCTYLVKQNRPQNAHRTSNFPSRTNPCIKCAILNPACSWHITHPAGHAKWDWPCSKNWIRTNQTQEH